jgi:hypothetical protein
MNRKRTLVKRLLVIIAVASSMFPVSLLADEANRINNGRFQIMQGTFEQIDDGGLKVEHKAIFKIDSVTGRVWQLVNFTGKQTAIGWVEITDVHPKDK